MISAHFHIFVVVYVHIYYAVLLHLSSCITTTALWTVSQFGIIGLHRTTSIHNVQLLLLMALDSVHASNGPTNEPTTEPTAEPTISFEWILETEETFYSSVFDETVDILDLNDTDTNESLSTSNEPTSEATNEPSDIPTNGPHDIPTDDPTHDPTSNPTSFSIDDATISIPSHFASDSSPNDDISWYNSYGALYYRILYHTVQYILSSPITLEVSSTQNDGSITQNLPIHIQDGFVILENHHNVSNGYFSSDVVISGVEHADNPDANTYCIIGAVNASDYRFDGGYFWMKLIYRYNDGTHDILEWTQTSWITENEITGADLFGVDEDENVIAGQRFRGLGISAHHTLAYLDGSGDQPWCYHAVASISNPVTQGLQGGIPAHNGHYAYSSTLMIKKPGILKQNDPAVTNMTCSPCTCCVVQLIKLTTRSFWQTLP